MPTENSNVPVISDIVLIGPMRAGKTTVAKCLVEKLGVPGASMDVTGRKYYKQAGFSFAKRLILRYVKGQLCAYQYFQQFLLPALERYLPENRNCVIDLGAGHTVYWNEPELERARKLLAPYSNVVLILPSPDLDVAWKVSGGRSLVPHGLLGNRLDHTGRFYQESCTPGVGGIVRG